MGGETGGEERSKEGREGVEKVVWPKRILLGKGKERKEGGKSVTSITGVLKDGRRKVTKERKEKGQEKEGRRRKQGKDEREREISKWS